MFIALIAGFCIRSGNRGTTALAPLVTMVFAEFLIAPSILSIAFVACSSPFSILSFTSLDVIPLAVDTAEFLKDGNTPIMPARTSPANAISGYTFFRPCSRGLPSGERFVSANS